MKDRAYYQRSIWKYEKRREQIRKRYGGYRKKGYAQAVKKIRRRLNSYRKQIKSIDARNKKIKELVDKINNFFEVNIKSKQKTLLLSLARSCYYKYGMEHGVDGSFLSVHIGRSRITAHKQRTRFTRSFKTNKKNKEQYHNFLNSIM